MSGAFMFITRVPARIGFATFLLVLLGFPASGLSQAIKASVRVVPFGSPAGLTHLFKFDFVQGPGQAVTFPSLTLTQTSTGPQLSNLALALPEVTIGSTAVTSRFGDQGLPRAFASSPLLGASVKRPMRGLSFSTAGRTPWTVSVGQLEPGSDALAPSSGGPAVVALATTLTRTERVSFTPRLLVPVGAEGAGRTNIGTAMRAELSPHISVHSDLGAADAPRAGWAPLASAGLVGRWTGTEIETSVLRGTPSAGTEGPAIVGSVDRELARGLVRPLPGLTVSGLASWSRPASAERVADTTLGSVGVVFDRLPYGQLAATRQRELTSGKGVETTRLEWRHTSVGGFIVRYTEKHALHRDTPETDHGAKLVEVDLPSLVSQHPGSRLNLRAALSAESAAGSATVGSRLSGRFKVLDELAIGGETEWGLSPGGQHQPLRALRLTSDVEVMEHTAVQLMYTYRAGMPSSFGRAFEARISRSFDVFAR
jgi:hypothetical protein